MASAFNPAEAHVAYTPKTRDQHFTSPGPKRILALDGGGLRGVLTMGYLLRLEEVLRERSGAGDKFRLAHYFDLIAGTSTGAIIAAALVKGKTAKEITDLYLQLGKEVFKKPRLFSAVLRDKFDKDALARLLKEVLGESVSLGSPELLTGVLIVTKRTDTGSPWPLGNNPRGAYFTSPDDTKWLSNSKYPLWQVVRASTAAPKFFAPEHITIGNEQVGRFVDGGVSPHNNPSLQAFMYVTLQGFRVNWPVGEDKLLIVSLGTGNGREKIDASWISALSAVEALKGLMTDNGSLVETMMQWMSTSPTARRIDGEIGDLGADLLGGAPKFTYLRYNVELTEKGLNDIRPGLSAKQLETLPELDRKENISLLLEIGQNAAALQMASGHFPPAFDL